MGSLEGTMVMNRRMKPRHKAEVTYDRLIDHSEQWSTKFSGEEQDAIGIICHALCEIADGDR